jgi:hypothetical protein
MYSFGLAAASDDALEADAPLDLPEALGFDGAVRLDADLGFDGALGFDDAFDLDAGLMRPRTPCSAGRGPGR